MIIRRCQRCKRSILVSSLATNIRPYKNPSGLKPIWPICWLWELQVYESYVNPTWLCTCQGRHASHDLPSPPVITGHDLFRFESIMWHQKQLHGTFVLPSFQQMDYDGLYTEEICGDAKVKGPRPHDISGDPTCRRGIDVWRLKILKMKMFTRCGKSWYGIHMDSWDIWEPFRCHPYLSYLLLLRGGSWLTLGCSCKICRLPVTTRQKEAKHIEPTFWSLWIGFVSMFLTSPSRSWYSWQPAAGQSTFEHDRPGTARPFNMSGEADYSNSTVLDPCRAFISSMFKCTFM